MELTGAKRRAFSAQTKQWKAKVSKGNEITKSILSVSGEKREKLWQEKLPTCVNTKSRKELPSAMKHGLDWAIKELSSRCSLEGKVIFKDYSLSVSRISKKKELAECSIIFNAKKPRLNIKTKTSPGVRAGAKTVKKIVRRSIPSYIRVAKTAVESTIKKSISALANSKQWQSIVTSTFNRILHELASAEKNKDNDKKEKGDKKKKGDKKIKDHNNKKGDDNKTCEDKSGDHNIGDAEISLEQVVKSIAENFSFSDFLSALSALDFKIRSSNLEVMVKKTQKFYEKRRKVVVLDLDQASQPDDPQVEEPAPPRLDIFRLGSGSVDVKEEAKKLVKMITDLSSHQGLSSSRKIFTVVKIVLEKFFERT